MKTKSGKHKIGLVSLGCAKNLVDSEVLMRQLEANQFEFVHDPSDFNGIRTAIVNTCGFIGDAKQESVDTILQFVAAKQQRQIDEIFVMGCLSERYRKELSVEIPELDGIFGVNDLRSIIGQLGGTFRHELLGERKITTPSHYAYLKIAEGCDRKCSFCVIPSIRGAHISRPMEDVIKEATHLVHNGVKEINLISQDTTYYGLDLYGKRLLPELLDTLAKIEGIEWIRLHYAYPTGFPETLLPVIRNHGNICKYLDIPLQHINGRILKAMNRGLDGTLTRKLVDNIRESVPGISIRTSFIVGYPGETEKEFLELCNFVKESRFERMGVFTYSHEEGSPAFKMKDSISLKEKQNRRDELMKIQEEISLSLNREKIGKQFKVVIDREEGEYFIGRTEADSPEVDNEVLIKGNVDGFWPGYFYDARIISADSFDLYAEIV